VIPLTPARIGRRGRAVVLENRTKWKNVLSWTVILAVNLLLIAEGGWQRLVALVGIGVAALVGFILWIAKKLIREESN